LEAAPVFVRTPSYRHHKPTNQAVVTLNGRDFYLGVYGSATSRAEYDRLIAEWLSHGRRCPGDDSAGPTVNEILLAYIRVAHEQAWKSPRLDALYLRLDDAAFEATRQDLLCELSYTRAWEEDLPGLLPSPLEREEREVTIELLDVVTVMVGKGHRAANV
jgi:hypothetical protein